MTKEQQIARDAWDACIKFSIQYDNAIEFGKRITAPSKDEYIASLTPVETSYPPPYILERENGISWYKFLHVAGGAGNPNNRPERFISGGEYDFCVFYATPTELQNKGEECHRFFCIAHEIPYGIGKTINEAYENLKSKP